MFDGAALVVKWRAERDEAVERANDAVGRDNLEDVFQQGLASALTRTAKELEESLAGEES